MKNVSFHLVPEPPGFREVAARIADGGACRMIGDLIRDNQPPASHEHAPFLTNTNTAVSEAAG